MSLRFASQPLPSYQLIAFALKQPSPVVVLDLSKLSLEARPLPVSTKEATENALDRIAEENDVVQGLVETIEAQLSINEADQATPEQTSEQA